MTQPDPAQHQISIELPAELEVIYSNLVIINHSPSEIILDFTRLLPGAPKARVHARIVMTPLNAKLLLQALQENLARFEERFGEINKPTEEGFQAPPGLFDGRKPGA